MKKLKIMLISICAFLFITPVSAAEINHFYAKANNSVTFTNTVNGSAAIAGEKVKVDGKINGILFGAGLDIKVAGENEYAAVAGETVNVTGKILKESAIAGSNVNIDANFDRDVVIFAEKTNMAGKFGRNVIVAGTSVTIDNAVINGDLKVTAEKIKIGKDVKVTGTLTVPEDADFTMSKSASIAKIKNSEPVLEEDNWTDDATSSLFSFLGLIVVFAVMTLLFPSITTKIEKKYKKFTAEKGIELFAKGLAVLIAVPIIAIILLCTVIGIPLALITIALYVIAIYLAKIFVAYLIGSKIADKWMKKETGALVKGLIGLVIVFILTVIPVINGICILIFLFVGLGMLFDILKK